MLPSFRIPLLDKVSEVTPETLRSDLTAGLTVALLAVPQCMAYALIARLDPEYGLYAALIGVLVGGIMCSSERIITGPTAKISLVVGGVLVGVTAADNTSAVVVLSVMVGLMQILFALFKIGNLARFVSRAVITGFIMGGAIVIIGDQLFALLNADTSGSPFFVKRLFVAGQELLSMEKMPWLSMGIGSGSIAMLLGLRMINDRIPGAILTITAGATIVYFTGLGEHLEIVGRIPEGLPPVQSLSLDLALWQELFPGALALTILCSVQSVSIAKSIAADTLEPFDENQELLGQGLANASTGFLTGFPITASFSRSFMNHNLNAQTRFSSIFCGLFIGAAIFFASPLLYYIPIAVLSGLIIVVVADVLEWNQIKTALSTTLNDRVTFIVTFISMLVLKLDWAIYLGVFTSLVLYIRNASTLDLREYIIDEEEGLKHITNMEDRVNSGIAIIDVNGEAFFGASTKIRDRVRKMVEQSDALKVIVLRMRQAMNLDVDGARELIEINTWLEGQGKTLMLCGTTPQIRRVLQKADVVDEIGEDKILIAQKSLGASTRQALKRAKAHIDAVLEGEDDRDEESNPPLQKTMKQLQENDAEEEKKQDPVEVERRTPDEQ